MLDRKSINVHMIISEKQKKLDRVKYKKDGQNLSPYLISILNSYFYDDILPPQISKISYPNQFSKHYLILIVYILKPSVKKQNTSWEWWCKPLVLVLMMLRQENFKFKTKLGYVVRSCLRNVSKRQIVPCCSSGLTAYTSFSLLAAYQWDSF